MRIGGSNALKNLWPQSYQTQPWNAHVKDHLENVLHRLVCAGQLALETAQRDIATDWIAAYHKYVHTITSNHKLTTVLKSRAITGTQSQDKRLIIALDDGVTTTVNMAGSTTSAATGGTIAKVRQQDTQLALDFEDGATMLIRVAEATSSVMVRDKDHTLEYAD
jgi:hypothetical protein